MWSVNLETDLRGKILLDSKITFDVSNLHTVNNHSKAFCLIKKKIKEPLKNEEKVMFLYGVTFNNGVAVIFTIPVRSLHMRIFRINVIFIWCF